jgi:transposase-like protein
MCINSEIYCTFLSQEKGLRSERALDIALGEMYVGGVSTRRVSKIVVSICSTSVSSTMVSNTAKKLDEALDVWRECPLGKIDYLMVDARYEQVRVDGLVRDFAVLIALGIDAKDKREVLGTQASLSEAAVCWRTFFAGAKAWLGSYLYSCTVLLL